MYFISQKWVEEKTGGRILSSSVVSISIQLLRKGGPDAVFEHLCGLPKVRKKFQQKLFVTLVSSYDFWYKCITNRYM